MARDSLWPWPLDVLEDGAGLYLDRKRSFQRHWRCSPSEAVVARLAAILLTQALGEQVGPLHQNSKELVLVSWALVAERPENESLVVPLA